VISCAKGPGEHLREYIHADRRDGAGATIRRAIVVAEQSKAPDLGQACCLAAGYYFGTGRWDDSLTVLELAADLPGPDWLPVWVHGLTALITGHRGDAHTAKEHLAAVRDQALDSASLRGAGFCLLAARALAAERAGRPDEAMAVLAECLDPGVAKDMQERHLLLPRLVRAALAGGDHAAAAAGARAAAQDADRGPLLVKTAAASVCRGLVEGDPGLVQYAAACYQSAAMPFNRARALEDAAVLLAPLGRPPAARYAFVDAVRLYANLGAEWDLRRADARLRRYGIEQGWDDRRPRPAQGWDALTPTETKVARLVADGRSNPDIAAELFLSRNTVQTHVSHILAKLGARSRAEIMRQALVQHPFH
jgi:DNA-binding CsgD family transcriptional regulator